MVVLLVAVTFIILIAAGFVLERSEQRRATAAERLARQPADERFLLPKGYFVGRGHSWAHLLLDGTVRIGIDDFVQKLVGTIDTIRLPARDISVQKDQPMFTIQQGNRTLAVASPLTGKVVEVNDLVERSSSLVNEDPYARGWIARLEPTNLEPELRLLGISDGASQWLREEIRRFRNFFGSQSHTTGSAELVPAAGVTLLDGGMPLTGVLKSADEATWKAFEDEFLSQVPASPGHRM